MPQHHDDEPARYVIRVGGRLGPLFLATLPHRTTQRYEDRTTIVARVTDEDLVDVLLRIAAHGGDVESVRRLGPPA